MKKIILAFIFLLLSNNASGAISKLNGHDWESMDNSAKSGFTSGFLSGSHYVASEIKMNVAEQYLQNFADVINKVNSKFPEKGKLAKFTREELLILEYSNKSLCYADRNKRAEELAIYNISVGQIVEGLNLLYQDFKNKNILLSDAIHVVKKQIEGYSQEDIERILLFLRSGKANNEALIVIEKGDLKHIISFP